MAERGQVIEGIGSSIEFVETTADSDGERVVVLISYDGTAGRPPRHLHPNQDESFEVLDGEIHALVGEREHTLHAGDTLEVPAGTPHEMWCEIPSSQRWTTTPALGTERFFETIWGLQRAQRTGAAAAPSLPQMALELRRFSDEFRLAEPPEALQELLSMPLAELRELAGESGDGGAG